MGEQNRYNSFLREGVNGDGGVSCPNCFRLTRASYSIGGTATCIHCGHQAAVIENPNLSDAVKQAKEKYCCNGNGSQCVRGVTKATYRCNNIKDHASTTMDFDEPGIFYRCENDKGSCCIPIEGARTFPYDADLGCPPSSQCSIAKDISVGIKQEFTCGAPTTHKCKNTSNHFAKAFQSDGYTYRCGLHTTGCCQKI